MKALSSALIALCAISADCAPMNTVEEVAAAKRYPVEYCAVTNSREACKALVAELWAHDEAAETKLWPEGKVPFKISSAPIKFLENELWQRNLVVTDINDPFFTFFPCKGKGAKPVVVILPGGGYMRLGWNKEGTEVAKWLNSIGFSAAVLLYRAPDQREAALCDTQRAIRLLRRDANKYGIDKNKIGVIGFSAGANLAARTATNWRKKFYPNVDDADDLSCRPDFQLLVYPWDLQYRNDPTTTRKRWKGLKLRPEYTVDFETPPAFIAQSLDDFCKIETAIGYDHALRRAGVESIAWIYENGGHGYGGRKTGKATDAWPKDAENWLQKIRFSK